MSVKLPAENLSEYLLLFLSLATTCEMLYCAQPMNDGLKEGKVESGDKEKE